MASFLTDNDDLLFYFDKGVDWAKLASVTEYGFRAPNAFQNGADAKKFYREVAEMFGEFAATEIAPRASAIDREDTHLVEGEAKDGAAMEAIFAGFKAADVHGLCVPRELGGLNAPLLVYFLAGEMIARGDVSCMTHFSFHGGMAMAMLAFSIHEGTTRFDTAAAKIVETRFATEIAEIVRGDAWGCMDITEPNAGSDMAALRTRAEQDASGQWFITGQKIFITSGHGKYHFVIARTEEAQGEDPLAGLRGLTMFLVKAYEDLPDRGRQRFVTIDRVEEKLGHHGSVTASLAFDRAPARIVGKRGEGFQYMLNLMNNARIGVGFESIGLAECAFRMARDYAEQRTSMGKPIARHEMLADWLDEMETDIVGLRALAVTSAVHEEIAQKESLYERFGGGFTKEATQRLKRDLPQHRRLSRRYTPLLKYLAAEKAVEIARRNMQIHGGVGYTKDYAAEKLLRDALVLPVYEGTSQIQSLMAMKDALMGILKRPRAFMRNMARARLTAATARDPLERDVAGIQVHSLAAQQFLLTRTAIGKVKRLGGTPMNTWSTSLTKNWDPKRDFALAMLHAERLTRLLADEAIAEILLEQSTAFPERRALAERYVERARLRCKFLHEEITTTGTRLLATLNDRERAENASDPGLANAAE